MVCWPVLIYGITLKVVVCLQDLKSQEPVTLDFLDAELEDELKVEVRANLYDILSSAGQNRQYFLSIHWKSMDPTEVNIMNKTTTKKKKNSRDFLFLQNIFLTWVNNNRFFIFGWTVPKFKLKNLISTIRFKAGVILIL